MSQFYTSETLGAVQHLTPAGFLICKDVPIARTGQMVYVDAELPQIAAGRDRLIHVTRDEALFEPDAISSFEGVPLTDAHPPDFLNPRTWRTHSIGHVQNVRRDGDKLIADLVVTDHAGIEEIRTRKRRHISCGYDADYQQQEPGRARQVRIVGNHVALVREGRCGPTCSIGDEASMSTVWEKVRAAFASRDETLLNTAIVEAGGPATSASTAAGPAGSGVQVHVHTGDRAAGGTTPAAAAAAATPTAGTPAAGSEGDFQKKTTDALTAITDGLKAITDRLKAVEEKQTSTTSTATGDGTTKALTEAEKQQQQTATATVDGATARIAFQATVSKGEVILPGVSVPTLDAAMTGEKVVEQACEFRRRVLGAALIVSPRKEAIQAVMPKDKSVHTMDCAAVETAFDSAYEIARASNNKAGTVSTGTGTTDARGGRTGPYSPEEINTAHKKQWAAFQPENQR